MQDNYYNSKKTTLLKSKIYDEIKDYAKFRNKVNTYFEIGRLLSLAGKEYGKNIIKQYSEKLIIDVGKEYKVSNLYKIRKFYEVFSNEKLYPMGTKLSWTHYRELLSLKNIDEIKYYISVCEKNNFTKRELHEKIKSNEYKIKLGDRYNYIDLLLFNIEYNCYVVVELKVTELKKEHIGQIELYMNYIDRNFKRFNQDNTIGIIICRENNKYVIKYCSNPRIIPREYLVK